MANYLVVTPSKRADHMCVEKSFLPWDSEICHMPLTSQETVDACDSVCHSRREKAKIVASQLLFMHPYKKHLSISPRRCVDVTPFEASPFNNVLVLEDSANC
ncbi:hypothetical protein AVEN_6642-1 [Araneus ventricosus]|uniref:Uncharacterized protein n=1 Tax=Araneus ventricosus TaxID=182803 RepID=A0A4Y2H606_ARAVE|nr:hypothetical protein AVEN_6642-1 [Araneus ventricosus]